MWNPRVGHPAKEGLRLHLSTLLTLSIHVPRVGHPAKEGLRYIQNRSKPC